MPNLTGWNLYTVYITILGVSSSGAVSVQLYRGRQAAPGSAHTWNAILTTEVTIDQGEYSSNDAATPAVVDTTYDDIVLDDMISINVTAAGTDVTGLWVGFSLKKA
jgi:hypothetical protein